jgi:hypothetical protein
MAYICLYSVTLDTNFFIYYQDARSRQIYNITWNFLVNNADHSLFKKLCVPRYYHTYNQSINDILENIKKLKEYYRQCDSYVIEKNQRKKDLFFYSFVYLILLYLFAIDIS